VSVYSLVASRIGAVATEFTDTEVTTLQTDVSASAGASVPAVAKADATSRIGMTQSQQGQIVRKALVQTTFRDLYEYEKDRLRLSAVRDRELAEVRGEDELFASDLEPWVVRSQALGRGDLIEAELELGADAIFRMSAVVSAITEIVYESPELRAAAGPDLEQVAAIARIIERLLVGLVPLRGRVVDFEVAASAAGEVVAPSSLLNQVAETGTIERFPLYIVGVAEEGLFWKDVRRVLFSGSRYRALCRLSRPGTQRAWTPVKLIDVLGDFAPELAAQLREATDAMTAAAAKVAPAGASFSTTDRLHAALLAYATEISARSEVGVALPELERVVAEAAADSRDVSLEERRRAFARVTEHLNRVLSVPVDAVAAAQLRHTAWSESDPSLPAADMAIHADAQAARRAERYLDVDFVAIYW
jgi:hypothetical protein